ncbi:MAG TPA: endonuclease/exonuclease/phosphatase family protein [Solirubrobacterales bacterium]|nr:endonuclease/exonuclease/phosphatase family protein [Solirubrobacterales bacterium]
MREASVHTPALGRGGRAAIALLAGIVALTLLPGAADAAEKGKKKGQVVKVMTRNLYLGADLGPALSAPSQQAFIEANGQILRQVDATNFPVRAKALASEIKQRDPDLVGMQEVALWRTGPFDLNPPVTGIPVASDVKYDFLQLLLTELNSGKCAKPKGKGKGKGKGKSAKSKASCDRYRVAIAKNEFDFEAPADYDGNPATGVFGGEINGRLTMRDVILVRDGAGVKVSKPISGTFPTLLRVNVSGLNVNVTRGWTALDARVRGSEQFRFVNLHHEAFDSSPSNGTNQGTTVGQGEVREAQAKSLVAPGGPANTKLPVILLGDLNSDDDTVGNDGDVLAYNALVAAGLRPVDTSNPLSCCLSDPNLVGGSLADFDHHIDHVMTDSKAIRFRRGFITGRAPVSGLWPSDHNGVTSELTVPRKPNQGKQKGKGKKR